MPAVFETPAASAIPISFVTKSSWDGFAETLPQQQRQFAAASGFVAKPGAYLALPAPDGTIARVLFGLEDDGAKSRDPFRVGSLPGLLPGRRHIVLTRDPAWRAEGAEIVRSGKEAIAAAASERLSVIGGAEIYALMLPHADRIELTEVDAEPAGDTFVPAFDSAIWRESAREVHPAAEGRPGFSFVTLLRR